MNLELMTQTANDMVAHGKGILAADESTGTIAKRLDSVKLESTQANRQAYRQMLFTTPGLGEHVSGVILYDETLRQSTTDGVSFVEQLNGAGIIPGIKVDTGAKELAGHPGEKVTEGLDGLRERLAEYFDLGARFAKWRAVITIGDSMPTSACVNANCHALARYAALCQEASIVPIVEPEVLMNGSHDIETSYEVTEAVQRSLFEAMYDQNVIFEASILKPSMVISGDQCPTQASPQEVADATVQCLYNAVPPSVPGIVFLSGGQTEVQATEHLNLMNQMGPHPWALSFSYGRALQHGALNSWGADPANNVEQGQSILSHRAKCNGLAAIGKYEDSMDQ